MVTLANSKQSSNARRQQANANSNQSTAKVNGFPAENQLRDMQFKLAHNLQCSLDLHTTLELFFKNIQETVTLSGMRYSTPDDSASYELGQQRAHKASYKISANEQTLGTIIFSRAKRFVEVELAALEMLLGVLYYPLRNALLYQQALESSLRDPLTGIGNRAALDAAFEREVKLAKRHQQDVSLLVIDLDRFKKINDTWGHQNGDRYLKHISRTIQKSLRETDQVFRYGGEEFVVLLNNTNLSQAEMTAERIRLQIAMAPIAFAGQDYFGSASIGVAYLQEDDDAQTLMARADKALYRAKEMGRNRVER